MRELGLQEDKFPTDFLGGIGMGSTTEESKANEETKRAKCTGQRKACMGLFTGKGFTERGISIGLRGVRERNEKSQKQ